jgi:hypothetical protein
MTDQNALRYLNWLFNYGKVHSLLEDMGVEDPGEKLEIQRELRAWTNRLSFRFKDAETTEHKLNRLRALRRDEEVARLVAENDKKKEESAIKQCTDPGWREFQGEELYFVDDENFCYALCQTCTETILKSSKTGEEFWQCDHGPEEIDF